MKYIYIFFLFTYSIFAQDKYLVVYEYTDINGHTAMSELIIDNGEAVFKIHDNREAGVITDKATGGMYYANNDELSTFTYSNNKFIYVRTPYRGNEMLYKYKGDYPKWTITENTKQINNYNCTEALLTLHGRKYQAWFTTEIPISYGPMKLNGLPGLVVEATADGDFFNLKIISIKEVKSENKTFSFCKNFFKKNRKKIKVYNEYEKLATEVMIRRKLKLLSKVADFGHNASVTFDENQNAFTRFLIDIPEHAIEELQKIN